MVIKRRPRRSQGGVVTMEFVVAFGTVLTLLLGLLQVAHGYVARLLVTNAAERAARAAAVWTQEVQIGAATNTDLVERATAAAALALAPVSPPIGRPIGRGAAAQPFVSVAQAVGAGQQTPAKAFTGWSAAKAVDADVNAKGRPLSKLAYAFHATDVQVQQGGDDRVSVTVKYAYYCPFPLANIFYGLELSEVGGDWQSRLSQGGAPPVSRVRIIEATQEHFVSPRPEG